MVQQNLTSRVTRLQGGIKKQLLLADHNTVASIA